ncbi:rhamnosyltransferase [Pseudobutyrivibrio sp. 49]|uniref:glycosyltransferase n=1 Tax=Pseudobutyrivibrio sp. 49 TaxID=1855344 RepID=UPI000880DB30|nr:glycosyltransferase [Pseudobutyrivibrio sp. 49]SDH61450.1 rhamnosyltransferase [Pseudobutyrivibrio sp. 49]
MEDNRKICVLMSTYNGEKYIREQLDSILAQENVDVSILIRDDGSKDATLSILDEYCKRDNVHYYVDSRNLGACNSFIDLMWHVSLDYDYYALSDQDDFWLKDKLSTGVEFLENNSSYGIYSSYYTMVDEKLEPIANNIDKNRHEPTFGNAMIDSQVTGCTVVMTKAFLEKVRSYKKPKHQYIHDWWLYKVGMLYDALYIDKQSKILYRQHGSNTIGLDGGFIQRTKRIISNSKKMKQAVMSQNEEFVEIYPLNDKQKEIFDIVNKKKGILKLLFAKDISRRSTIDTIIYKLWMATW